MTDRYPKVWTTSVYAATNGRYMGNFVSEGVPLEEGLFVPLGGVHLYRDENGDWSDADAQRMIDAVNPSLDVMTSRRFRLGLSMAKGMLDALAQEEPQ